MRRRKPESLRLPAYMLACATLFVAIMFGFLLQWPTIVTVVMFPILVVMYLRLAKKEEADSKARFSQAWDDYASRVPAFMPRLSAPAKTGGAA